MKKLMITFVLVIAAFAMPSASHAKIEEVCSQSYGQPVVCGVKTPEEEHVVVEAGLIDDPRVYATLMIAAGIGFYLYSFKDKLTSIDLFAR